MVSPGGAGPVGRGPRSSGSASRGTTRRRGTGSRSGCAARCSTRASWPGPRAGPRSTRRSRTRGARGRSGPAVRARGRWAWPSRRCARAATRTRPPVRAGPRRPGRRSARRRPRPGPDPRRTGGGRRPDPGRTLPVVGVVPWRTRRTTVGRWGGLSAGHARSPYSLHAGPNRLPGVRSARRCRSRAHRDQARTRSASSSVGEGHPGSVGGEHSGPHQGPIGLLRHGAGRAGSDSARPSGPWGPPGPSGRTRVRRSPGRGGPGRGRGPRGRGGRATSSTVPAGPPPRGPAGCARRTCRAGCRRPGRPRSAGPVWEPVAVSTPKVPARMRPADVTVVPVASTAWRTAIRIGARWASSRMRVMTRML